MNRHPVEIAADIAGSQNALAVALGVSKGAVSQWKEQGRQVPAEHCPLIEKITGGVVRCEHLRPDIEWSVLRSAGTAGSAATSSAEAVHVD